MDGLNFIVFFCVLCLQGGKGARKIDFVRTEPANELGIFTKVIAQVFRKANQTTDEMRINRKYMGKEYYDGLLANCGTGEEGSSFKWRNCVTDEHGLYADVSWGVPEPKNKTVTYLEIEFRPFEKKDETGDKTICVLDEIFKEKAFIVMQTFSLVPANDTFPRGFVESVDQVHHHELYKFDENFLDMFGDNIDRDAVFNFGVDEYYDRDPPYECFLSIGSSESASVIEEKCDFFCPESNKIPPDVMEQILKEAKAKADEDDKLESTRDEL